MMIKTYIFLRFRILADISVGGGPNSTAAFHARVWGSVPGLGGLKETKIFFSHPRVNLVLLGASVTERQHARPQTTRARILCL